MIKGYITEHDQVIVWTNHFVHNKDIHAYLWEHDIEQWPFSFMFNADRQIDR